MDGVQYAVWAVHLLSIGRDNDLWYVDIKDWTALAALLQHITVQEGEKSLLCETVMFIMQQRMTP